MTSPAAGDLQIPVQTAVPGCDGVGDVLDGEGGPARWLLVEGFVYHLRADDDGRWAVREMATPKTPPAAPQLP